MDLPSEEEPDDQLPTRRRSTDWSVTNFKSIEHATMRLAGLAVITGANSAGKSSLLQSLLFAAQSVSESRVTLNGPLVSLGEPADAIRIGQKTISLSVTAPVPKFLDADRDSTDCAFTVDLAESHGELTVAGFLLCEGGSPLLEGRRDRRAAEELITTWRATPDIGPPSHIPDNSSVFRLHFLRAKTRPPSTLIEMDGLVPGVIYQRRSPKQRRDDITEILQTIGRDRYAQRELTFLVKNALRASVDQEEIASLISPFPTDEPEFSAAISSLSEEQRALLVDLLARTQLRSWDSESLGRRGVGRSVSYRSMLSRSSRQNDVVAESTHYLSFMATSGPSLK